VHKKVKRRHQFYVYKWQVGTAAPRVKGVAIGSVKYTCVEARSSCVAGPAAAECNRGVPSHPQRQTNSDDNVSEQSAAKKRATITGISARSPKTSMTPFEAFDLGSLPGGSPPGGPGPGGPSKSMILVPQTKGGWVAVGGSRLVGRGWWVAVGGSRLVGRGWWVKFDGKRDVRGRRTGAEASSG
jgi:hypothetical protein